MSDPTRAMHQFDNGESFCVRCLALRIAIEDGFVNTLCGGQPIAYQPRTLRGSVDRAGQLLERVARFGSDRQVIAAVEQFVRSIVREEIEPLRGRVL